MIYGVDQEYLSLANLSVVAGEKIRTNTSDQLMISQSLVKSLGYSSEKDVIGKNIELTLRFDEGEHDLSKPLKIVGVLEAKNGTAMYVSQEVFKSLGVDNYKQVKVVAKDDTDVASIRQQIEALGYQTTSPLDTIDQVNRFFKLFNIILLGFGGIGILIATTGMLNTLTVALLERTKEVGLMVALGARRRDMRRLFVSEALLLTLFGGVAGIIISLVVALIVNIVSNNLAISRGVDDSFSLFAVPWWLIVSTLLFMGLVGYIVSLIPAIRAGKIAPIDALRHE